MLPWGEWANVAVAVLALFASSLGFLSMMIIKGKTEFDKKLLEQRRENIDKRKEIHESLDELIQRLTRLESDTSNHFKYCETKYQFLDELRNDIKEIRKDLTDILVQLGRK